ncbi:methyltransferase domain-containing protein [Streptomyces sioyaensis]|uniref:methyltransferase domain-containing protein n=1 Tax=Streptomyces sioyaensis TaxID=67364 RepID=UPI0027DE61FD|nr:methyltransferase domain-containing protein [Streptomyces sioyaensis]
MSETTTADELSTAPTGLPASPTRSHVRSLARCEAARTHQDLPRVFTLRGRDWDLLDEVFAPDLSPSTELALDFLGLSAPSAPLGAGPAPVSRGRMLEIGSGAGVVSVLAALSGYDRVVAADINEHAVRNTGLNIARHGVGDRVRAVHSDLFAALPPAERFDTVFWSSNYVLAPGTTSTATTASRPSSIPDTPHTGVSWRRPGTGPRPAGPFCCTSAAAATCPCCDASPRRAGVRCWCAAHRRCGRARIRWSTFSLR